MLATELEQKQERLRSVQAHIRRVDERASRAESILARNT
jgi:hypothetical protein